MVYPFVRRSCTVMGGHQRYGTMGQESSVQEDIEQYACGEKFNHLENASCSEQVAFAQSIERLEIDGLTILA